MKVALHIVAERQGFEPWVPFAGTTDFESVPFDHSGTSPHVKFAFRYLCLIKRILKCNAKSIGFVRV